MEFRSDINALRAVAVVSVVLFHFGLPVFFGGFVGVDVFFVISGFLMTGIIIKGLHEGRFSLLRFYASRSRRIIPALAVMCFALLVFGFIYLPLEDFRDLAKGIKNSLFFGSNFYFAGDGGYFDAPLSENWMLHTWSLSVEWQFYMVYPILLIVLHRFLGFRGVKITLVLIAVMSLVLSVYVTSYNATYAFYMLPTRAWQMIAGGLVFLFPLALSKAQGRFFEVLGLSFIFISVYFFSEELLWPGYLALLPVVGAVLVIYGNSSSRFSRNRLLQFVGKISYSVYLWHWPLVVFLYTCGLLGSLYAVTAGIALSFVLGAFSFYLIESKESMLPSALRMLGKYLLVVISVAGVSAAMASAAKKYPDIRFPYVEFGQPDYRSKYFSQECFPNDYKAAECKLGEGEVSVILFGDSHAQSTAAAVQLVNKSAALSWARGGCPTLLNFSMRDKKLEDVCRAFVRDKVNILADSFNGIPLVVFNHFSLYLDQSRDNDFKVYFNGDANQGGDGLYKDYRREYVSTICELSVNRPVFIVRPVPVMPFSVYKGLNLQKKILGENADIAISLDEHVKRNHEANLAIDEARKECNVKVLDPAPYLCPDGKCLGSYNGKPLYYDDNHLVDAGNDLLKELFIDVVR
ncbi:acyltransferase family protein [Aestuariirhabdus sp. LZHN29]|uniref:acyltransferase family protein n=1 Tax=Aestuariirhabdus sp. LZHN29 TaxID=3417462 RepID=UPI003CF22128